VSTANVKATITSY